LGHALVSSLVNVRVNRRHRWLEAAERFFAEANKMQHMVG
jgi:hypothetical protein